MILAAQQKIQNHPCISATGETVTNRFDDSRGDLTYLSRSDPEATAPSAPSGDDYNLPEGLYDYDYVHEKSDAEVPIMGVDNQIKLKDLKGLDYDDPKWNKFLDQFTDNELVSLAGNGGYWTIAIDRLGIPRTQLFGQTLQSLTRTCNVVRFVFHP